MIETIHYYLAWFCLWTIRFRIIIFAVVFLVIGFSLVSSINHPYEVRQKLDREKEIKQEVSEIVKNLEMAKR